MSWILMDILIIIKRKDYHGIIDRCFDCNKMLITIPKKVFMRNWSLTYTPSQMLSDRLMFNLMWVLFQVVFVTGNSLRQQIQPTNCVGKIVAMKLANERSYCIDCFICLRVVFCVPNMACFSGLSIIERRFSLTNAYILHNIICISPKERVGSHSRKMRIPERRNYVILQWSGFPSGIIATWSWNMSSSRYEALIYIPSSGIVLFVLSITTDGQPC